MLSECVSLDLNQKKSLKEYKYYLNLCIAKLTILKDIVRFSFIRYSVKNQLK